MGHSFIYDSDHASLSVALTAAAGQVLVISQHNVITTPHTVPAGTHLFGDGGSIEITSASQNALEIGGDDVTLEGVEIIGPSSGATPSSIDVGNGVYAPARHNLTIKDCKIRGFNSCGILLQGCNDATIRGNRLYGNRYSFGDSSDICLYSGSTARGSRIVIEGNFCLSNNSQGIYVSALGYDNDVSLANNICVATSNGEAEVELEPEVGDSLLRRHGISVDYGTIANSGRVAVVGNVCRNTLCTGIYSHALVATTIAANICELNGQTASGGPQAELCGGIVLAGSGEGTILALNQIYDCRAPGKDYAGGITLNLEDDSKPVVVTGNTINGSAGHGIVLKRYAGRCTVSGNEIRNVGFCDILEWPDGGGAGALRGGHYIEDNRCVRANGLYPSIFILSADSQVTTYVRRNKLLGYSKTAPVHAPPRPTSEPDSRYPVSWDSWVEDLNCGVLILTGLTTKPAVVEDNLIRNFHQGIVNYGYITGRYDLRRFDDNDLEELTYGMVICATSTAPSMLVSGNTWKNVTNRFGGGATLGGSTVGYSGGRLDPTWEIYGLNAAPTVGTWIVGDEVKYTTVTSGGSRGSICTTAGAPGTWKSWGPIS